MLEPPGNLWTEPGEPKSGLVAEVAPVAPVFKTYFLAVPAELSGRITVGHRVTIPIGRRGHLTIGFVIGLDHRIWESTLRPINSLVDDASYLSDELVRLARELAVHYHCPLGRTLKAITPEAVRQGRGLRTVAYVRAAGTMNELVGTNARLSGARRAVIEFLANRPEPIQLSEMSQHVSASTALIRKMAADKLVLIETREVEATDADLGSSSADEPDWQLNEEQQAALAAVERELAEGSFRVVLLHGVSGSGKTEVYIHAIRRVIGVGRQAILMVPEIVLTTQLVQRLARRLPRVAVLHSGLSEAARSAMWRHIAAGRRDVVIGTRSAVFAPCPNLGLIVVDEEQEPSFKNLQAPRFHVRDAAIMRARQNSIPVVLGSATPSVEIWHRAQHRQDHLLVSLPHRIRDLPMPQVHIVGMEQETAEVKRPVILSRLMEKSLRETLQRGEQAILLMNRRGFATRVYCAACRTPITCPNCNVNLVAHSAGSVTMCHYCRVHVPIPAACPVLTCGGRLVFQGAGTQRIERVLAEIYPAARVRRVDSDTMRRREDYEQVVADFEKRNIDVLLGTQMIAKGLDFPFVSFVGVFEAGASGFGDYRAHERLFQLITQVAGRAGRADVPGTVVVQVSGSENGPALRHALNHDYVSFAQEELSVRERIGWPPFRRVARAVLSHEREQTAAQAGETLAAATRAAIAELDLSAADVLGPSPCLLSRIRGKYRHDLLIRARGTADLRRLLHHLEESGVFRVKSAALMLDVDPVDLA